MKVLIVDDEEKIRDVLREYIEFDGGEAYEAVDGMEAVKLCKENDYDIILMDIMMPKLDGFSAVKEIKKVKNIPVIILSARQEEYDKLFGFEMGVDDYVTKPFSPKELIARIHAVLKRYEQKEEEKPADVVQFEGLVIDMAGRNVYVDGEKADLTPKEYEILFYFVKNKGIALTREKLLMDVWGFDFYGDDRTVDTHIKMLRSNLKQYRKFIVTLRGLGFKFVVCRHIAAVLAAGVAAFGRCPGRNFGRSHGRNSGHSPGRSPGRNPGHMVRDACVAGTGKQGMQGTR